MKIDVLSRAKKKKFVAGLSELGIKDIPQTLIGSGKEKIRAFSGEINKEDLLALWKILPVEGIGLYAGKDSVNKKTGEHEIRLTMDGLHLWGDQVDDRVLELDEEQEKAWFLGENIELDEEQEKIGNGFVSVKDSSDGDFIGVGKIGEERKTLFSFLPKERRRRERAN